MESPEKNQKFSLSKEGLDLIQKEMSRYETRLRKSSFFLKTD